MLQAKTRIILRPKGGTGTLYIPAGVVKDSLFPFGMNDMVLVRIRGRKLIVERYSEIPPDSENCAKDPGGKKLLDAKKTRGAT